MNSKTLIGLLLVIILIGGGIYYLKSQSTAVLAPTVLPSPSPTADLNPTTSPTTSSSPAASGSSPSATQESKVKEFTVTASDFSFDLKQIKVNKGDTVKITLSNTEGNHDLVIDEFDVTTPIIGANKQATISFVADQVGSFEYYCSVGQHRQMGMKGTLIVQ